MSRPFPFPSVKKDSPSFDPFMANVLTSCVDMQRALGRFQLVSVPSSASASGSFGMVAIDSNYVYFCTATDTWKRVAISTW